MHFLAPFVIMFGIVGLVGGGIWLVAAGSDQDGGPDRTLFFLFGLWYLGTRVMRELSRDPMSVLPAFGMLLGGGGLIWLGIKML
jgi:hypothetical protein